MRTYWRMNVQRARRWVAQTPGQPRDLYVAPWGADTNPGTFEQPLRTIRRALELATDSMGIHPASGEYAEPLELTRPVQIRPLRRATVVLTAPLVIRAPWCDLNGVQFSGVAEPIRIAAGAHHLLIRQNRAWGCRGPAIRLEAGSGAESFIQNNAVEGDGQGVGILVEDAAALAETVIAMNRIRHFATGIELRMAASDAPLPALWGNQVSGCPEAVVAVAGQARRPVPDLRDAPLPALAVRSQPQVLWVAPTGDDHAAGTETAPLATLGAALAQAAPGDEVRLRGGEYRESPLITASGAPGHPLMIAAAPGEDVRFVGNAWTLRRASHLVVRGISLRDVPLTSLVLDEGCCRNRFEDFAIIDSGFAEHCFSLLIEGPGARGNHFRRCQFRRSAKIAAGGKGDTVDINSGLGNEWNCFERCLFTGYLTAFHLGHGAYAFSPSLYTVIRDCEFHHNVHDGVHVKTSDNLVYHNHFHHNYEGLSTRGAERNLIVGNRVEHNQECGLRAFGEAHVVWGNLFRHNAESGIRLGNIDTAHYQPAREFEVCCNLFVGNGSPEHPAALSAEARTSARLIGNLFIGNGGVLVAHDPQALLVAARRNLYWQGEPPLLRECDGGTDDACLDPELTGARGWPVVRSAAARAHLDWPNGKPPAHPLVKQWLAQLREELAPEDKV